MEMKIKLSEEQAEEMREALEDKDFDEMLAILMEALDEDRERKPRKEDLS